MGKSIKFFKKLTSLVLAGLTIFSSVPAKAWKEEDPRDAVNSEVNNMLEQGYHEITTNDLKDLEDRYHCIISAGRYFDIFDVCRMVCNRKGWNTTDVVSIDLSDVNLLFRNDKYIFRIFYTLNLYKFGEKFCNLIKLKLDCDDKYLSIRGRLATNFKKLKLIDLSRCWNVRVTHVEEGLIFNNYIDAYVNNNCIIKNEGFPEDFDMFEGSRNGISFICPCGLAVDFYKSVMGKHNTRHKIYDVNKLNVIRDKPIAIQCEKANKIDRKFVQENNGKYSKNILIPKNVKKIEKDAFKNAGLCGVTFEEGMEEIEFCDECFAGCPLVKFELPKSLKKITLRNNCFENCDNRVAIVNYIRAEQMRIENEEIKKREEEERKRQEEAERKRKEEEERKRKEEEEKMKCKQEELDKWKKETRKKIEDEKAKLQKEISGDIDIDRDGDEILDENSLKFERTKALGVKEYRENELEIFLENHPECITYEDEQNFGNNWANKIHQKLDNKNNNKNNEIDKIRAELISKEDKLLRSKLEVAKLKVELYDKEIENKRNLINSLDKRLKDLEEITEIQKEYDTITNLMVENEVLKNNLKLRIEEAKKQKEEYEKLKNKLSEKEKLQKEIGIGHEKTAKELNEQKEEQGRTAKQQAEEKGNLERKEQKLNERQKKLNEEQSFWNKAKYTVKVALTTLSATSFLSSAASFIPVVGPIITSVVQPIITSSVSAVTSIVGLVANLTVDICKSLFTSKSKKEVHQKPSNSASNTSATPV